MTKKLREARITFVKHFKYSPNFPSAMDFDQDAYTIKKYGTKIPEEMPKPEIIWD